jgi:predicted GNAT superfamily acetyltransferase
MEVRPLSTPEEFAAVDELAGVIWRTGGSAVVPRELLRVLAVTGSYVAGAYDGPRLIGFAVGILGMHDGALELHSHVAGVHAEAQNAGVGFALKLDQRRWALERGIREISWTFDPLVRRNAVFNLAKLGAVAADYRIDFYGEMSDGVNAGQGSDRWWVRWQLDAAAVPSGAKRFVDAGPGDRLVATPADIEAVRRADPPAARRWRERTRAELVAALADGHVVAGVTADSSYVLRRLPVAGSPTEGAHYIRRDARP